MAMQELLSAQFPTADCHTIAYELKSHYPNSRIEGTEEERLELLDLKLDLESWIFSMQNLDNWRFPEKLQAINATYFRIKYWTAKVNGRQLEDKHTVGFATDNRDLNSEPFRIGRPDEETLHHVIEMIEKLRTIWSIVAIKYTEAVVKTSTCMEERIMRCHGLVDFN